METSYRVVIWNIETRKRKKVTNYRVSWRVEKDVFRQPFPNREHAKSFHAALTSASRKGEAFRIADGLPVSMGRKRTDCSWHNFAQQYVSYRWPNVSPGHRRNIVDALTSATFGMLRDDRSRPDAKTLRRALRVSLNPRMRGGNHDPDILRAIRWLDRNTESVSRLAKAEVLEAVLSAVNTTLDGKAAADATRRRKRATLTHLFDYAVLRELLDKNPLQQHAQIGKAPTTTVMKQVDKRNVVNPIQARVLLNAVYELGEYGQRQVAFFACMYFAALRPEEAANLNKADLSLPAAGWGNLHLSEARPEDSAVWTDSGERGAARPLKHRRADDGRKVPCVPELTAWLHWHLETYGTAPDGRLFRGARSGGRLASSVYGRTWDRARAAAFTEDVYRSALANEPYSLRHAGVSSWLAAGIEPKKVAGWAGHSVAVLLHVYAKCLDRGDSADRDQIAALLNPPPRHSPGERGGSTYRQTTDVGETQ